MPLTTHHPITLSFSTVGHPEYRATRHYHRQQQQMALAVDAHRSTSPDTARNCCAIPQQQWTVGAAATVVYSSVLPFRRLVVLPEVCYFSEKYLSLLRIYLCHFVLPYYYFMLR